ncbi:2TM domain-containing protein [Geojedonia litorea]|uniref:2TM domain-containing protein n=1 Tax=Geojedonia litorea TaxID=1268269 RepID=A0ABV9N1C4_9FLAO
MKTPSENKDKLIRAKEKVRHLKVFYVHLVGYIIVVLLLLYNLYIIDDHNRYADFFKKFNTIIILAWTVFIAFHAWNVFKGRLFFKKSWEDRKLNEYLENEDTKWE